MQRGSIILLVLLCSYGLFVQQGALEAAVPPQNNNRYVENSSSAALHEMRNLLENLRHQVSNQEIQLHAYDEKFANMDAMIEAVHVHLTELNRTQKEHIKSNLQTLEAKITTLESSSKGVTADLKQLKTHANDTSTAFTQLVQKFDEVGKVLERQSHDINHLQEAMRSLLDALHLDKEKPVSHTAAASGITYRVKPGDTLEKIANLHQTTVRELRELNNIPENRDKIVVGKVLLIPEKKK